MAESGNLNLGLVGYVPPGNINNANYFLRNFYSFQTRHKVVFFGYGRCDIDDFVQLRNDPEYLKKDPIMQRRNRLALPNATFFTGVRLAHDHGFSHMIYLEPDCRIGRRAPDVRDRDACRSCCDTS